jgi:two-component system sensor histidine kinase EvgS
MRDMAISGQVPEMASSINMAVDPHYPILRDIINVTSESISASLRHSRFLNTG